MKTLLIWLAALTIILSLRATEAIVHLIGDKGDCLPATSITKRLDLHGIEVVTAQANGGSVESLKWPYDITFTSLPLGQTNLVVVTTIDFLRRTNINTFEVISRERTYPPRR